MNDKVLGRGNNAIVLRIVSLHAGHESYTHARRQKGVFPVRFLAAAPARIAEDVDVRRPEIETPEDDAESRRSS